MIRKGALIAVVVVGMLIVGRIGRGVIFHPAIDDADANWGGLYSMGPEDWWTCNSIWTGSNTHQCSGWWEWSDHSDGANWGTFCNSENCTAQVACPNENGDPGPTWEIHGEYQCQSDWGGVSCRDSASSPWVYCNCNWNECPGSP